MGILPVAHVPLPVGLRILPDAGRKKLNKTPWRGMIIKRNFLIIPGVHKNGDRHVLYFMEKAKSSARTVRSKLRQRESGKDAITSAGIWPELMQPSWEGQGDLQGPVHTAAQLLQEQFNI